ncbi:unnamed protein product [Arctia plantaginis]|uniref:PiggyBac transposable element-derived protein domain-containing protein n=1 Tax=Arctia plantaginis TaxID=874455 RepID=A0A8S1AP55_ARCPL|nr:unnamed protein product [Arctia plantaginis]
MRIYAKLVHIKHLPMLPMLKALPDPAPIDTSLEQDWIGITGSCDDCLTSSSRIVKLVLSTSTRTEAFDSGRSARSNLSIEIDVQIERDLEVNSGSEIDEEENVVDRLIGCTTGEDAQESCPTELNELLQLDSTEDQAIRNMAAGDMDVLSFNWCADYNNFEGVQEEFSGPSGPTFDHSGMSPLQVFQQIWDTNIIDHIVNETNRYARQLFLKQKCNWTRLSRWKDVTSDEFWRFLSNLMLQSVIVNNVEREYWYPRSAFLQIGDCRKIKPYNRFLLIKRCLRLHFNNNSSLPEYPSKLQKIMPIIKHLNEKFSALYLHEQKVAIDESLLLWKGRLSFSQKIATKRAREGIKSYELCESRTGYLWKMDIYSGKGHVHARQEAGAVPVVGYEAEIEPENATSKIVYTLLRPLFGRGHTVVMDNFYNSPLLSRLLKSQHKTDTMGTLRLNREFVPEALKVKNKTTMKSGEVSFSSTKDLCVLVYLDKNIVPMISTYHRPEVGGIEKYGYYKYRPKLNPNSGIFIVVKVLYGQQSCRKIAL